MATSPLQGRITSPFGNRVHPITKVKSFHNGVDIAAAEGTPVAAPESGEVTQVYTHRTGGLTLIMIADSGTRYGFCHLQRTVATIGERVAEGHVVARSGNTGASTGAHLHFTVQENGQWVDPETRFKFQQS